jgi:hypothetical protein
MSLKLNLEQDPAIAVNLRAALSKELETLLKDENEGAISKKLKHSDIETYDTNQFTETKKQIDLNLVNSVKNVLLDHEHKKIDNDWYRVPVTGDGGCMFTSVRLGWELISILETIKKGETLKHFILDGHNVLAIRGGFLVRQRICEWYKSGLTKSVPSMGKYTEADGGRDWMRGDLLAMEMVQRETDVPEEGKYRTKAQLKYLLQMMLPKTWGGTPEYFAFAHIFKIKIVIYVPGFPDPSKLVIRDCIDPGNVTCSIPVNLLFIPFQRHYELLLLKEQFELIGNTVGFSKISNILKI